MFLSVNELVNSANNLQEIQRKVAEQKRKLTEQLMHAQRKMAEHKQKIYESKIDRNEITSVDTYTDTTAYAEPTAADTAAYTYEYSYTTDNEDADSFEFNNDQVLSESPMGGDSNSHDEICQGTCKADKSTAITLHDGFYRTTKFIKESILQLPCYQKDYLIEEGQVYTKQEFAKYLALQEKKALVDPFFREHWRNYSKKFTNSTGNATADLVPFGPDCKKLICGSCKVVIDEFATALVMASKDPSIQDISDVAKGFCNVKEIALKFQPGVGFVCSKMFQAFSSYVTDVIARGVDWKQVGLDVPQLYDKRKEICVKMGLCAESSFHFVSSPANYKQEHWSAECYVCRHMAADIEDHVSMLQCMNEDVAMSVARGVCERVNLSPEQDALCRRILDSKLPGLSWLAKVHAETRGQRTTSPDMMFPERVCISVGICEKWVDPFEKAKKEMELDAEFW